MTRAEFVAKAVREYEKKNKLPAGWWGDWRNVEGPGCIAVKFSTSRGYWRLLQFDKLVSKHDSREGAIRKAQKLV